MSLTTVGCKLPHGLIITVGDVSIELKGQNSTNIIGGHGITEGVDKELFEKWLSLNKDSAAVKNGLIFSHEKASSVRAEAMEKKDNKNGFEGIDPANPGPGVAPVVTE